MSYSLNEVEVIAKRAARGAGFSWGLAEEAGKAVRWLCAWGLDGCGLLARLLEQIGNRPIGDFSPSSLEGEWGSPSGRLCPLTAGATLSDCAVRLGDDEILMTGVMYPALILPFAVGTARQTRRNVTVTWNGLTSIASASDISLAGAERALTASATSRVRVVQGGVVLDSILPPATRAMPSAAHWSTLTRMAHRTYAPATDASRLLGAGAGVSDND